MRFLINTCYGDFGLSEEFLNTFPQYKNHTERNDPEFIKDIEKFGLKEAAGGYYTNLAIVDIPDTATDWFISDYDGIEDVIYVLNGKIRFAC